MYHRRLQADELVGRHLQRQTQAGLGAITVGVAIAGLFEQRDRPCRIVRELKDAGFERPRRRRQHADRRPRQAAAQVIDDRLAIDGVTEGMADAPILQHRIAHVDADVGVVDPRGLGDGDRVLPGELVHYVG